MIDPVEVYNEVYSKRPDADNAERAMRNPEWHEMALREVARQTAKHHDSKWKQVAMNCMKAAVELNQKRHEYMSVELPSLTQAIESFESLKGQEKQNGDPS